MARISTAERTREILKTATYLLASSGYTGLTTASLARELSIKEMIIYRCFKNKQDLVKQCLEKTKNRQLKIWGKVVQEAPSYQHALFQITAAFVSSPSRESAPFRVFQRLASENVPHELKTEIVETHILYIDFLTEVIEKFYQEVKMEPPGDCRNLAWVMIHWGTGIGMVQLLEMAEVMDEEFQRNQIRLFYKVIGLPEIPEGYFKAAS